jgi:hypothetical protein
MKLSAYSTHTPPVVSVVGDSAVSRDAELLRNLLADVIEFPADRSSAAERKSQLIDSVLNAAGEASTDNWDHDGARAVRTTVVESAVRFAEMLPATVPLPEVSPDADGDISFDWHRGPRRVFSVSLGADGVLRYAGLFGYNSTYGTEFLAESLPSAVRINLRRTLTESV